jgi:hypothetical protein
MVAIVVLLTLFLVLLVAVEEDITKGIHHLLVVLVVAVALGLIHKEAVLLVLQGKVTMAEMVVQVRVLGLVVAVAAVLVLLDKQVLELLLVLAVQVKLMITGQVRM